MYTLNCRHSSRFCHLQKISYDSALVGYILNDNNAAYLEEIDKVVSWCYEAHLILNVDKQRSSLMILGRKKMKSPLFVIKGKNLRWSPHINTWAFMWMKNFVTFVTKAQSRLFFLGKLRSFEVSGPILNVFYECFLSSVLFYAVVCWGGSIRAVDRSRINKLVKKAGSIIALTQDSLESLTEHRTSHPLCSMFVKSCCQNVQLKGSGCRLFYSSKVI